MNNQKGLPTQAGIIAIIIAVVIVAAVLGTGGYFIYRNYNQPKLIGGDKDAHGCLPAAGYTWCEVKNKCIRPWEEKCEKAVDPTAGWKTYTNAQYGFELNYPKNLIIKEEGPLYATIVLNGIESKRLSEYLVVKIDNVPFLVNSNDSEAKKVVTVVVQPKETCDFVSQYKSGTINIGGEKFNLRRDSWQKGYAMSDSWQAGSVYDILKNDLCYSIGLGIDGTDNPAPNYNFIAEQKDLEKIAYTFKFTK